MPPRAASRLRRTSRCSKSRAVTLTATTLVEGRPVIRTRSSVEIGTPVRSNGQLRYVSVVNGALVSGR